MDIARIRAAFAAVILFAPALVGAQAPAPLQGVWGSSRLFGPDVRGTLEIVRTDGDLRARIAQHDVRAFSDGGRVQFRLPAEQGSFDGRMEQGGAIIRGHWTQPKRTTDGASYISPVVLRANPSRTRWSGTVTPLDDDFTIYLVFTSDGEGTKAFIRNPDRNLGLQLKVDRVERDGDRVKLVGKFRGRGDDRVFAEGTYRAEERLLSLYFPGRGGSYDFTPIDDESGFYARPKREVRFLPRPPMAAEDGWKTGALAEAGLDPAPLAQLVSMANAEPKTVEDFDLHGLLIARHGKLVFEEYFHGFHRLKPHETRSAGKVLATTLVGAAMQKGVKLDPSTRVYDVLKPDEPDPLKKRMTVGHLLTMSSGYDCDDWDGSRPGSEDHLLDDMPDEDFYRYTLQLPMEMEPGKQAVYCSINPNLVGAVVARATQRGLAEFFDESIARPMEIDRYYLSAQPTGEPYLGGGLKVLPRDFMKFGQVMLDGGTWKGVRILPPEFARTAGKPLMTLRQQRPGMHYGYLWWTIDYPFRGRTITAYFASGNGGNVVVVLPDLDMVVAAYGGNYNGQAGWATVREYIPKYILAAVKPS